MHYIILTLMATSSTQCIALKPSAFYVLCDDIISPGLLALHIEALKAFKTESSQTDNQDPYHFYDFNGGRDMALNPQGTAVTQDQAWQAIESKMSETFVDNNAKAYAQGVVDQEVMKLLYLPAVSFDNEVDDYSKHITWLQMHVVGGQRLALQSALDDWVQQLEAKQSQLRFSVYQKTLNSYFSQFVLIFHRAVHTPLNQLLPRAVLKTISAYDISQGVYQPTASYGC